MRLRCQLHIDRVEERVTVHVGFGQRGAAQKELAERLHLSRCERPLVDVVKQAKLHPKLLSEEGAGVEAWL